MNTILVLNLKKKPETDLTEADLVPGGLEKLKLSGLEDKYAESRLFNENEETQHKLGSGLSDIDLENNDFEDPSVIWSHPPDLDQTPREGLTEISLKQTDIRAFPQYNKRLGDHASFSSSSAP